MIHTIEISDQTAVAPLKKLFRKKLMTGGAVLRLKADLSPEQLEHIFSAFSEGATEHNVQGMVLRELAKEQTLSQGLTEKLSALKLQAVSRELQSTNRR